jgi:hypothetical protein
VRAVLATLIVVCSATAAQLSFEVRLSSGAEAAEQVRLHFVRGIAYSPNGKQIAAVVGHHGSCRTTPDEVVIVPADGAASKGTTIQLDACASEYNGKVLHWAPDNCCIAVTFAGRVKIIRLENGRTCEIQPAAGVAGFIEDELVVVPRPRERRPDTLTNRAAPVPIYDCECAVRRTWMSEAGSEQLAAFGPPAILLRFRADQPMALIDPMSGDLLRRLPPAKFNPRFQFGAGGKVLCVGQHPAGTFDLRMSCYRTNDGAEAIQPNVRNGAPFDVARNAPVLIATDETVHAVPFSFDTELRVESWIVWDLAQGRELARLPHQKQNRHLKLTAVEKHGGEVARAALSPNGDQVATGADDLLRVYYLK